MTEILAAAALIVGAVFLLAGSLGVYRFEDVYIRIQASSKSLTFGLGFFLLGTALLTPGPEVAWKSALAVILQIMTAPIAAYVIAHAAMRRGLPMRKVRNAPPGKAPPGNGTNVSDDPALD